MGLSFLPTWLLLLLTLLTMLAAMVDVRAAVVKKDQTVKPVETFINRHEGRKLDLELRIRGFDSPFRKVFDLFKQMVQALISH